VECALEIPGFTPLKSIQIATHQLQMLPVSTAQGVTYVFTSVHVQVVQLLHGIMAEDRCVHMQFGISIHQLLDNDFLKKIMFSFHMLGKVNKQNVRIWGIRTNSHCTGIH
jgi:hypothetical protein